MHLCNMVELNGLKVRCNFSRSSCDKKVTENKARQQKNFFHVANLLSNRTMMSFKK